MPTKVNSLWRNPRLLIALHSPNALTETELRMCLSEKTRTLTAFDAEQSVLCSPVCLRIMAKYGHCSRTSAQSERKFSAIQTAWRSEYDSNPHYLFELRKPRCLRKLQGIKSFENSPATGRSPSSSAKQSIFEVSPKANPWRFRVNRWSFSEPTPLSSETAWTSGQSLSRNSLRRNERLSGEFLILFKILARSFSAVRLQEGVNE
jgi:hypothetical protein